jgi:hypothetical protein
MVALVNTLTAKKNQEETMRNLLQYLNNGRYQYSLKGLPVSKNPLETFLFESKYGNCEYFASALAVMLRVAGIPSRMIGGYRGGYYNEVGKYYLVPQKNAHVWVETFIPRKGWIRVDPTPASADTFALPLKGNLFLKMSIFFDTINYYWYTIVINYNLEKQLSLANTVMAGLKKPSLRLSIQKRRLLITLTTIAVAVFIGLNIRSFLVNKKTIETKILSQFLRKMEKQHYKKTTSQGLEEFVFSIEDNELKTCAFRFVADFEKIYYRDKKFERQDIKNLRKIIRQL